MFLQTLHLPYLLPYYHYRTFQISIYHHLLYLHTLWLSVESHLHLLYLHNDFGQLVYSLLLLLAMPYLAFHFQIYRLHRIY